MLILLSVLACTPEPTPAPAPPTPPPEPVVQAPPKAPVDPVAAALFRALPARMDSDKYPQGQELIDLGRQLYYDVRLSKNHDISCNTCHQLDRYGVDGEPTSPGHKGVRGNRNSPTTYNAALHISQFWDGRADDVEDQAKGPVLNPVEMAMKDGDQVLAVLKSIPGYVDAFKVAFPDQAEPITYDNFAVAVGAFERGLVTPAPLDGYLTGQTDLMSEAQIAGMQLFIETGCTTCHMGVGVGGGLYQTLGLVHPYETGDIGRATVTGNDGDKFLFKVPSLRNITETGPYFHDGSVATLEEAVKKMGYHQLGKELDESQVASIVTFLGALKGTPDAAYIAPPTPFPSGPTTPAPDPS